MLISVYFPLCPLLYYTAHRPLFFSHQQSVSVRSLCAAYRPAGHPGVAVGQFSVEAVGDAFCGQVILTLVVFLCVCDIYDEQYGIDTF